MTSLLPPRSTKLERDLEAALERITDIPVPLRTMWDPSTCPGHLLPWLAWGISVDFWDSEWTDAQKRDTIASSIEDQRRKGTLASLRSVVDRFDPLIRIVEWFEDRDTLAPHSFRLELPLWADSAVIYDEQLVAALLRDIAAVKPLRSHLFAVHRLIARTGAYFLSGAQIAGFDRLTIRTDLAVPADPAWAEYLQTEEGEPVSGPSGEFLETA